MDGWWPDRLLGQGPDNRTCVRLRHAGCPAQGSPDTLLMMMMMTVMMVMVVHCPAQGPPDTPAEIKTTWWWEYREGWLWKSGVLVALDNRKNIVGPC